MNVHNQICSAQESRRSHEPLERTRRLEVYVSTTVTICDVRAAMHVHLFRGCVSQLSTDASVPRQRTGIYIYLSFIFNRLKFNAVPVWQ
jgi:hypothetical protein